MMKYSKPEIVDTPILIQSRGRYSTPSKKAKGIVIHYTAGRFGNGSMDARRTLANMAIRNLGCFVMDQDGKIYKAQNQDMSTVVYHAGPSKWLDHEGMSRYLYGIEVCCAGKLQDWGDTWYGDPIDEKYRRIISEDRDNQKAGIYHAFTNLQELSLINFCLWQLDTNPEFDIDYIVGHDEIAPTRKTDPGGSLSMTMPDFRELIRNLSGRK